MVSGAECVSSILSVGREAGEDGGEVAGLLAADEY